MQQSPLYDYVKKSFWIRRTLHNAASFFEGLILSGYKDPELLQLIKTVNKECEMWVTTAEAAALFSITKAQQDIPGAIAEVGVFQGGTAKLICEAKGEKPLYLFDTFTGIPEICEKDEGFFEAGMFNAQMDQVQNYLSGYAAVSFHQGIFPATGTVIKDEAFSMVFLDVDTYKSTKESLEFFYPRLNPGGVILCHDYQCPGVRRAVEDAGLTRQAMDFVNSLCLIRK